MAKSYHPRRAPCSGCGDTVLVGEERRSTVFGLPRRGPSESWLEHADPGPDGELFDAVDGGCRRPRVRRWQRP